MTAILENIPLLLSIIAIILTYANFRYTQSWNQSQANTESYFEPLNYYIEWEDTDDDTTIQGASYLFRTNQVEKLPNKKFTVTAVTGGIKSVSVLFYRDGECLANIKIRLTDKNEHNNMSANRAEYVCEVLSLYPQEFVAGEAGGDYYTSLFVVIEGYNNDKYITPFVFEYGADKAGNLTGDNRVREYDDVDILYTYNTDSCQIPEFDLKVLKDYEQIEDFIKAL